MSTLATVFGYGLLSARAAASVAGRFYYATDTSFMYRDNGSTWDTLTVGAGSMATDTLWDAKGDLAGGTGANTGAKLTVGADDTILMADAAQSTGLKWVASATPSTQAFGDAAAVGTADTFTRGDHKHAMPSNVIPWSIRGDNSQYHSGYTSLGAVNRAILVPCIIPAACTITGVRVGIGTSSGNVCVGLYDSSLARVATSGSVASPGTGQRSIAFTGNYSAAAGRYYLAVSAGNTTVTFSCDASAGLTSPYMNPQYMETAFPLPDPFVSAGATSNSLNLIGTVSGGYP